MKKFNLIYKKVEELKPYINNPRNITEKAIEAVKKSILRFGVKQPLVIDKENTIVAGHTRLKALMRIRQENPSAIDFDNIPCVLAADLTENEIKAYRLADNKTSELSLWSESLDDELANVVDIDMKDFGFEDITFETQFVEQDEIKEEKIKEAKKITCPSCGFEFEV